MMYALQAIKPWQTSFAEIDDNWILMFEHSLDEAVESAIQEADFWGMPISIIKWRKKKDGTYRSGWWACCVTPPAIEAA